MKGILAFIFTIFYSTLSAQDVKVSVTSGGAPLGYAYVYINGRIFASVGAEGVTYVPRTMLHLGDTVRASFVGMEDGQAVFREEQERSGSITVDLRAGNEIERVEVMTRMDVNKFFRKFVNRRGAGEWFDAFVGDFNISNGGGYMLEGSYARAYLPGSYIQATGAKTVQVQVKEEQSDSVHTRSDMLSYLSYFFGSVINAGGLNDRLWYNKDMVVRYIGREGDIMHFFLSRPRLFVKESFQTILSVDSRTKELVSVKGDFFGANDMSIRFEATYKSLPELDMTYPGRIEGAIYTIDGNRWDITMDEINYDDRHRIAAASRKRPWDL